VGTGIQRKRKRKRGDETKGLLDYSEKHDGSGKGARLLVMCAGASREKVGAQSDREENQWKQ